MNHQRIVVLMIFTALLGCESSCQDTGRVRAFLIHLDARGTSVHSNPKGKIIAKIVPYFDSEGMYSVVILRSQHDWLKVQWDSIKVGWIQTDSIGVWTRDAIMVIRLSSHCLR